MDRRLNARPNARTSAVTIGAIVALNFAIVGLLAWALTERMHVSVTVSTDHVTADLGGATLTVPRPPGAKNQIGLFLQGSDPHATVYWSGPGRRPLPLDFTDYLYRLGTESSWSNVSVTPLVNGIAGSAVHVADVSASIPPSFGDWFHDPLGGVATSTPGLSLLDGVETDEYRLDADLLRPRNAAGLMVLTDDGTDGLLLYFRPENRDVMFFDVRENRWYGPLATVPYLSFNKDPLSASKDVTRLLVGGYAGAIGLIAVVLAIGFIEVRVRRPLPPGKITNLLGIVGRRATLWRRVPDVVAFAITVVGLGLTLYVASSLLDRMPHVQDSVAYLFQAKTLALGRLWVPTPTQPQFFNHEFIVMDRLGRWFSKYPPGWPALLALGTMVGAPWVVDPILGALSLILIYRIGRETYGPTVGLIAAALGLSAPFFIFLSGSMMAHTSGLFFTLLMSWSCRRASRSTRPVRWAVLAGVSFGFLFLIRPFTALVVVLPFIVLGTVTLFHSRRDGIRRFGPSIVAALPFLGVFCAYNKVLTGDWFYPPQQLWWQFDQVGFGPGHGPWGFTPIDALNNTSRNLSELLEHGLGWPLFLTLSLPMLPFLTGRARSWDWYFLLGVIGIVGGYGLWWADGIMFGPRFYYEGFGFLLLLTARGVQVAFDVARLHQAPTLRAQSTPLFAPAAIVAALGGLVAFNVFYYLPGQWTLYHGYNYVSNKKIAAVTAAGLHDALVFTNVGLPYEWWEYGMVFSANDPELRGDVIYARDLGDDSDRALLSAFPGRAVYRLNGTTVQPLDLSINDPRGPGRGVP